MSAAYLKGPAAVASASRYWCEGKAQFESAVLAQQVAQRKSYMNRETYRCRTCGRWHLGQSDRDNIVVSNAVKSVLVKRFVRPA